MPTFSEQSLPGSPRSRQKLQNLSTATAKGFRVFVLVIFVLRVARYHQQLTVFDQQNRVVIGELSFQDVEEDDDTITIRPHNERPLPCALQSTPTPMILMSLGRSGTASMHQVLSKLTTKTKREVPRIFEYTGGSTSKSRKFFQDMIPSNDVNGDWLIKYMCREQQHYPEAGIVGFKW